MTLSENEADHGGAIINYSRLTVENSTISGNRAAGSGAGVYVGLADIVTTQINNSTTTANCSILLTMIATER